METHNLVKVRYLSSGEEEYVDDTTVNELITSRKIRALYRPSEDRWVGKTLLAVRRGNSLYAGTERRALNKRILSWKERTLEGYRSAPDTAVPERRRIDTYC